MWRGAEQKLVRGKVTEVFLGVKLCARQRHMTL